MRKKAVRLPSKSAKMRFLFSTSDAASTLIDADQKRGFIWKFSSFSISLSQHLQHW
jgi:hypothetical protein